MKDSKSQGAFNIYEPPIPKAALVSLEKLIDGKKFESDNVTIQTNQPMTTMVITTDGHLFVGGLDFQIFIFRDEA